VTAAAQPGGSGPRGPALDGGRLLAGVGALALLISLFLNWWVPDENAFGAEDGGAGVSAWNVFELIDILLALLAVATIALAAEAATRPGRERLPALVGDAAGPAALVLVVVSLVNEPPLLTLGTGADPGAGAWVALAGAIVMTIGSLLRHARISVTVSPRERSASETETRPLAEQPRRPPP
jgi:hypothetical protein